MSDHALLSASASHRWLACTPSPRLEETLPERESTYANEGRLAHEIGELKLRKHFVEPMGMRKFNSKLKELQKDPLYQAEMLHHTDTYLDVVMKIAHSYEAPPYVAVERRLDYSAFAPEGFGTGDCIVIGGDTLHVIDLKYGTGVQVSAKDNPQMKLYALGAFSAYSLIYAIKKVKLVIVQPRIKDGISEWEISIQDLLAWGESIKPIAQKAFAGEGEFSPGEHCKFCRAKGLCRARADFNTSLESFNKMKPPLITNEEVGTILEKARDLAAWVKDLESYALAECLAGREVAGWKAVEGRGSRDYANQDEAFKILLSNGIDEAMLYERVPLTVPKVEKLLGKTKYKELIADAGLVKVRPGKPTLAPLSDKREPYSPQQSAAEVFSNN